LRDLKTPRWRVWGMQAEANAMLGNWDALDLVLARFRDQPQADRVPRLAGQLDRARGIAGDEFALQRAIDRFREVGCDFELARCLEVAGASAEARRIYERLGADAPLCRLGAGGGSNARRRPGREAIS